MKKSMGLLVCPALALLLTLAFAAPHNRTNDNLRAMIDLIDEYKPKVLYVESVHDLTNGPERCGEKFFCKVQSILKKHINVSHYHINLVRNLKTFNRIHDTNCTEVLKNVTSSTVEFQLPQFLRDLRRCSECRSVNTTSKSC